MLVMFCEPSIAFKIVSYKTLFTTKQLQGPDVWRNSLVVSMAAQIIYHGSNKPGTANRSSYTGMHTSGSKEKSFIFINPDHYR